MSGSLLRDRFLDPGGRLTSSESEALGRLLQGYAERGTPAYVVVVPAGDPLATWRARWSEGNLRDDRDLLVLYDGHRWEARGWGLSPDAIARALDGSEASLRYGIVPGLEAALAALRQASPATDTGSVGMEWLAPTGLAAVLGLSGLGWVLARRMARAREARRDVDRARVALEDAVASVVMGAEALGGAGRALQDRAARLQQEVQRVPADEAPYIRAARVRQLEDEVAALSSEVLARGRGPARVPER